MSTIDVYLSAEKIQSRIKELGAQITKDYKGEEIVVISVLSGSFIFCADLIRQIKAPLLVDFIHASSYGNETTSSGQVRIDWDTKIPVQGKHVLLVEDIVDTGLTLTKIMTVLRGQNPKSFKLASLLSKPARTTHPVPIDYLGFEIEDKFVIGYGLDYADKYRELPYIGVLNLN